MIAPPLLTPMSPGLPCTRKARTTRYFELISLLCNLSRLRDNLAVLLMSLWWPAFLTAGADLLPHIRPCQEPNNPGKIINLNERLLHFLNEHSTVHYIEESSASHLEHCTCRNVQPLLATCRKMVWSVDENMEFGQPKT